MRRTILCLAIGGLLGAAAVRFVMDNGSSAERTKIPDDLATVLDTPVAEPSDAGSVQRTVEALAVATTASSLSALFEAAAAIGDPAEIRARIERLSFSGRSHSRDRELNALLLRLAQFDVAEAASFAWSRNLDVRFLEPLFRLWAVNDPDSALAELDRIGPAAEVRDIALAVLDALGNTRENVARLTAVLPAADRLGFEVEAMAARVAEDPAEVFVDFVGINVTPGRSFAGGRIAIVDVRNDPVTAFRNATRIENLSSRTSYLGAVVRNWIEADPEGVFRYLEGLRVDGPAPTDPISTVLRETGQIDTLNSWLLQQIANSDPERLLALADRLPSRMSAVAQRSGLQALASSDPLAALARLEQIPSGRDYNSALQNIASAYARRDPYAALAWAQSLSPPSSAAMSSVISGIAAVDMALALDLAMDGIANAGAGANGASAGFALSGSVLSRVASMSADSATLSRIASRIIGVDNRETRAAMRSIVSSWSRSDPEAAFAWMTVNAARLEPSNFAAVAQAAAQSNPDLAVRMLDTAPAGEPKNQMLQAIAAVIASSSEDRAMAFLEPRRELPGFDAAFSAVVSRTAARDPAAAARLLDREAPPPSTMRIAPSIAAAWARQDPTRAAAWAQRLADEPMQAAALNGVAVTWASRDAIAARRWVSNLPDGTGRDQALVGYLSATASIGAPDTSVLPWFSSDAARQQAVSSAVVQLRQRDPVQARALLDHWLTDPALRRQAEEALNVPAGNTVITSGRQIIVLP